MAHGWPISAPDSRAKFTIYDDDDQVALIKSIFKAAGPGRKVHAVSRRVLLDQPQEEPQGIARKMCTAASTDDQKPTQLASVYEQYEDRLRQANALDFDDLLLESVRLLAHDADLRRQYNRRFEFVMIDEYQDTNRSQYELMRLLTEAHKNVCRGGRRGSIDLRLARRRHPQHSGLRARLSERHGDPAGAELPLDQEHSGSRQRGGREQHGAQRQVAVDRIRRGRDASAGSKPSTASRKRCSSPTPSSGC